MSDRRSPTTALTVSHMAMGMLLSVGPGDSEYRGARELELRSPDRDLNRCVPLIVADEQVSEPERISICGSGNRHADSLVTGTA